MTIQVKKAHETPMHSDGFRVLVDRLWPRGIAMHALQVSDWLIDLAPSTTLRQWFDHDPRKWEDFKKRYFSELDHHRKEIRELLEDATADEITLVYSSKNEYYNNAVALKEYIDDFVAPSGL